MIKKFLSFIISLSVVLSMFPIYVNAAETDVPTRIQEEYLILSDEAAGEESEGWNWTPDELGGGTLILENCYIQSNHGIFNFNNITNEKGDINIILRGKNILEITDETWYEPLIASNQVIVDVVEENTSSYTISAEGNGSLEIRSSKDITSYAAPYGFHGGGNITIESGDIETNLRFCIISREFSINGGNLKIHMPANVGGISGIFSYSGPVNISGGTVDIDGGSYGVYIDDFASSNIANQTVNISGGNIKIKSYSGIYIGNGGINITGGNLECYGYKYGFYAKNVNIKGDGDNKPVVNVSNGEDSPYPSIYIAENNKVNISGSIVTADGISGYDSAVIEDSMVFNGTEGIVCGNVELTNDFFAPGGAELSISDGAVLTVGDDVTFSGPDNTAIRISGTGKIVNNGTIILPEDNGEINTTGTGIIKKGDKIYTSDNEQIFITTIKQPSGTTTEYHKEGDIVNLVREVAAEGNQFKEWKVTPNIVVVTDNSFVMPAENVTVEAVYEKIPSETEEPGDTTKPEDTTKPTQKPDSTQNSGGLSTYPVSLDKNIITDISASPILGGTVSGNTEAVKGESITITAVAKTGYTFVEWTEDGKRVSTDAKYTFTAEKNRTLVAVFKKNILESGVSDKINVDNSIKTVLEVPLLNGWEWSEQDRKKHIPAGGGITATAVYNAEDAKDYMNTSLIVTITRDVCEEDKTILYTKEGEYAPDCTKDGFGHTECKICGDIVREGIKVKAEGHTEGAPEINKATLNKDGSIVIHCIKCKNAISTTTINAVENVKLSENKKTYNEKTQYPLVSVKDSNGKLLEQDTDYMVSWAKDMKDVGIYNVKIAFMGNYKGTEYKTYEIIPKGTSISKVKAEKKGFNLKWKKQTKQTTGYQIQYSTKKKFTKKTTKKITVKTNKKTSKYIKCGKINKKYYVRIRTYKKVKVNGKTVKLVSNWSKVEVVK